MEQLDNNYYFRADDIDISKGIAILLVVAGHSIPDAAAGKIQSDVMRIVYNLIYSFHMPVFFFFAGFLSKRIIWNNIEFKKFITKKFFRLLVPYFFVGIIYLPFKLMLSSYANQPYEIKNIWQILIGINPDGELWFLYTLFAVTVLVAIFTKNYINKKILFISFLLALATFFITFVGVSSTILYYQFYFCLGINIRWHVKFDLFKAGSLSSIGFLGASLLVFSVTNAYLIWGHDVASWCKMITSLSGIYCTWYVASYIAYFNGNKVKKWLIVAGVYSMDIYIFGDMIKIPFRMLFWSKLHFYYLAFFSSLIFSVMLSYMFSKYIIRKNYLLKLLFLGIHNRGGKPPMLQ